MSIYKWKSGARMKGSAQVAGEECARIMARDGNLTPTALVDASRDEDAPLHGSFEWRDDVAAERYREHQALGIIRSLEIVVVEDVGPVRAFIPNGTENGHSTGYADIRIVLEDEDATSRMLDAALRELDAFRKKYASLKELADVFAAIDEVAA